MGPDGPLCSGSRIRYGDRGRSHALNAQWRTPLVGNVLTVSRAGTGSGTVSGNGIDCGSTCTSALPAGTAVSLSAFAAGGSTFAGQTFL